MKNMTPEQRESLFPENTVLLGYRGSIAHNMYVPNTDPNSIDDIDIMGVFMAPPDHYIGMKKIKDTVEKFEGQWDVVNYEFKKFVHLLLKSNPNVLSLLWVRENHYIERHKYGQMLLDNRDLFSSKLIYKTYVGYAVSQMKRMEIDKKYLGYMGKKRKTIVDKFGYDTKMASHTIRLLRMCIEFLQTGKLIVDRIKDRNELLDIKLGKWSKDKVVKEARHLIDESEKAVNKSVLPENPNFKEVNLMVKSIMYDYIYQNFTAG